MRTLYFECNSGISGDMIVSALLDLGANKELLLAGLNSLDVDGYSIEISKTQKSGIEATDFNVILQHEHTHEEDGHAHEHNHDNHSHEDDHIHEHNHDNHSHEDDHAHRHENSCHNCDNSCNNCNIKNDKYDILADNSEHIPHTHDHKILGIKNHEHRNLVAITHLIQNSNISNNAKKIANSAFFNIALAESTAHGKPLDQVHFHEVGAIDSIVDIVGASILLDSLNVDKVIASPLSEGTGYVKCQHGFMPIPVPAVLNIATSSNIPLKICDVDGEMVTPTGIGFLSAVCSEYVVPSELNIKAVGLGAGKKNFPSRPNLLRVMILDNNKNIAENNDDVLLLECNIDDQTGESLSYAMDMLFKNGATDAYFTPIYMKKNRPAQILSVICPIAIKEIIINTIFKYTTTIGVRQQKIDRITMNRTFIDVTTEFGEVEVKICSYNGITKHYVEFESAKMAAILHNVTIEQVIAKTLEKVC